MDAQSLTKSVIIDAQQIPNFSAGIQAKHLINTAKILRGRKLKTQDFIKLQLMKFRYCSPVKYEDQVEQNLVNMSKTTDFSEKYKVFDDDNEHQLHKFIAHQQDKNSKEQKKRLQLFNTQNFQNTINSEKSTFHKTHFTIKAKPATSQQHRNTLKKTINKTFSLHKTVPSQLNKLQFKSQNLGKKMNDFMNQMIVPSFQLQNEEEYKEESSMKLHSMEVTGNRLDKQTIKQRKMPTNAYMKQMKKRFKYKYENSMMDSKQEPIKINYQLKDFPQFDKKKDVISEKDKNSSEPHMFYSIQLRSDIYQGAQTKAKRVPSKDAIQTEKVHPYNYYTLKTYKA